MDKVREEFEAWAVNYNLALADWGNYSDRHVNNMWKSWQASRAALCVEIPTDGEASSFGNYVVFDTDDVRAMLDAAGVRYK